MAIGFAKLPPEYQRQVRAQLGDVESPRSKKARRAPLGPAPVSNGAGSVDSLEIVVSRPGQILRPNDGHGNRYMVNRARRDAKQEAWTETVKALNGRWLARYGTAPFTIEYTEILGPRARAQDRDNLIASMKPYLDGIFEALGRNDKDVGDFVTRDERGPESAVRVRVRYPLAVPA